MASKPHCEPENSLRPAVASRSKVLAKLRTKDAVFFQLTRGSAILRPNHPGRHHRFADHWSVASAGHVRVQFSDHRKPGTRLPRCSARQHRSTAPSVTSAIAMLIAAPIGLLIALFLTELCPMWLRRPIGIAVELLAGIPSIIYGIWGLFVLAPFLQRTVQPALISAFGDIPVLSTLFAGPPYGIGILTAGLILAIMVLPFVTSISRDVFEAVPPVLKEAAYGIGCTTWEVFRGVVRPLCRVGVIGGMMLALGVRSARPWRSRLSSATRTDSKLAAVARHHDLRHNRK